MSRTPFVSYDEKHDQWSHLFVPGHLVSPQGHPNIHGEVVGCGDEWVRVDWWDNAPIETTFRGERMKLLRLEGIR